MRTYNTKNYNKIKIRGENVREIKFRAFFDGKMITRFFLMRQYDSSYHAYINQAYTDELPLMQYTGRKDKNGKEIYESDIVSGGHVIKWNYEMCMWDLPRYEDESLLECEIIGNIYETPDLVQIST